MPPSGAASVKIRALTILWPAFLMAGVLEMLVFVVVDPGDLHWFGGEALNWSTQAVYTVTFLIFWLVIATAGALTALLDASPEEINADRGRNWPR
jgi:hypothetical protein